MEGKLPIFIEGIIEFSTTIMQSFSWVSGNSDIVRNF